MLELNVNHPVFAALKAAQEAGDTEKLNKYSALLYAQAQLIEGLPVDDPALCRGRLQPDEVIFL